MGQLNYTTEKTNELLEKVNDMPEIVTDGKTPVLETGTTTTLDPGQNATSEVVANGTDEAGNPKYKLNFGIPKGYDGSGGSGGGGTADSVQWANVLNKPSWVNSPTKPTYTASEVGALPSDTQIPSKTSQLTNDSGFTTSASFKTVNGQSIVGSGNIVIEGGGGDTPSQGGGNVNVTNGSALQSANYYAFKPSADGSLDGTFSVIPNANGSTPGLMSKENYSKLDDMKQVWKIPVAVLELTDNSTSDEIVTAFDLGLIGLQSYVMYSASAITNSEYSNTAPLKCFIGNRECLLSAMLLDNAYTLDFNYVDSGKLKIISITCNSITSQFSCKVTESGGTTGDNKYILSSNLNAISNGATDEEIVSAFGGTEEIVNIINSITGDNKKDYVISNVIEYVPVSVYTLMGLDLRIHFFSARYNRGRIIYIKRDGTGGYVRNIYPSGYALKPEVSSLTSSSSSKEISTAVGGESGLKNIIQAVKDGNRLVINMEDNTSYRQIELLNTFFGIAENGDMSLGFTVVRFAVLGFEKYGAAIQYTKSSNTFAFTSEEMQ